MMFQASGHVRQVAKERNIPWPDVEHVLAHPDQVVPEHSGRVAYQSVLEREGKRFLYRVVVATQVEPAVVVTVYRTTRIAKYWRAS